ncbi:MAG: hypothetical protein ACLPJH_14745 [Myxococcaceae bacterium]
MPTWTRMLALLVLGSAGLAACSSSTSNGTLNFTIAESLLVLEPEDPTVGFALLSAGTGNCAALQSGVSFGVNIVPPQISNLAYMLILLGNLDSSGNSIALTAGSYTVVDPDTGTFTPPGLLSNAYGVATDTSCNDTSSPGSSGTVTIDPFTSTDGGSSTLIYSIVFGGTQVSGTNVLTTCLVSSSVPLMDAGTCVPCVASAVDGGACAIQ